VRRPEPSVPPPAKRAAAGRYTAAFSPNGCGTSTA